MSLNNVMLTTPETFHIKETINAESEHSCRHEKDPEVFKDKLFSIPQNIPDASLSIAKDNCIVSDIVQNNTKTEINNSEKSNESFYNHCSHILQSKQLETKHNDNINLLQNNMFLEHPKKYNTYKSNTEYWIEKGSAKKTIEVNEENGIVSKVIKKNIKDFILGRTLGEGSYSTVIAAKDKQTSKEYAIKILDKRHIIKEKKVKYVYIEKDTLNKLGNHPGIVQLYYTFQDERNLYFVLSLASNGELLNFVKHLGSLNEECTRYYGAQILDAVHYIHSCGIIHRDLKPENVLLDDKMKIKITDFGTAKILESPTKTINEIPEGKNGNNIKENENKLSRANSFVGTAEYVSPELLIDKVAYKSSDIWAYGCIIYQLFVGRPPFKASNEYQTFQKIINLKYQFPSNFPPNAKDLCERILILDPQKRLTIEELKSHKFFDGMPWGKTLWKTNPPKLKPYKVSTITESPHKPSNIIKLDSGSPSSLPNTPKLKKHKQRSSHFSQTVYEQNINDTTLSELDKLWSSVLDLPNERLLRLGPVLMSMGKGVGEEGILSGKSPSRLSRLLQRKKTRNLLITSKGRALFVTEESNGEKKVKSEIPLGKSNIKIRLEGKSGRLWVIETPNKVYNFDDLHKRAVEWVELIKKVNKECCNH
ncbi:unnamed protein product [Pneumocystis jirovecii]|uniref:non-specific serine/threonine protein kinase n=2 Tax=Pneumocystis jirovecii TaxID=42068 RepID=L0PEF1_PNEJI|nr:uncharacterized protein T551_01021 [Pneumocystis jirovecii RU7]KTW31760.1 hypothetical protein T551_01021 [Pneumocystis jirovecii RU7]CCJ30781.1 unnamed protein product [Pneumocystis jirovecii]